MLAALSSISRRLVAAAVLGCAAGHAGAYPVTVRSCDRDVTFERAPTRAVSNDVNLTEMMLVLGLKDRLVGYTGIGGWKTGTARVRDALRGVPELASQYPSLEVLAAARADFYLAGWNYGMHVGGPVTPATLAPFADAIAAHGAPPERVDTTTGVAGPNDGNGGFSAAAVPFLDARGQHALADAQAARVDTLARQSAPGYYTSVLTLFGLGWRDGRYRFGADGTLDTRWGDRSCAAR
nr:glycosyl hydrolase family 8 [Burkholderia cenocepacia]